jgi:3-phenylpropionate/trans-cinnamate dioxygenase ferredoxin reductase component
MRPSSNSARVVVAGGGLAAARTVQQLRRSGHDGPIVLLAAEDTRLMTDRPCPSGSAGNARSQPTAV